jgi:leader peptidase (prepilin peptidase) / N-methyltransferase
MTLTWAVTGAGLGRAFHPLAVRLTATATPLMVTTLATTVLFGLLAFRMGPCAELLPYSCVVLIGVQLAAIDLAELRLPGRLIWLASGAASILFLLAALRDHNGTALLRALISMAALPAVYLVIAVLTRGGMGAGDIRLAALVGLALGWRSWSALIGGTLIAFGCAVIVGLILIATGRATRTSPIPYGPAMLVGTVVAILAAP